MRLSQKVERGVFTTIIEVFPPNFSAQAAKEPLIGIKPKLRDMVARVKKIENLADAIMVADMKETSRLELASVYTSAVLRDELGIEVIPVIPARDMNRKAIRTMFLTALSLGLESVALVWGDRYAETDGSKNVYDFRSLSEVIAEMRALADRADINATILSPVDLSSLRTPRGLRLVRKRVESGADGLLAQPPTVEVSHTLEEHLRVLDECGLTKRVLPNVFPFRDRDDIQACRTRFGWNLPTELDSMAVEGERRLLKEARGVVEALRGRGLPGVYVSTRGKPELAKFILD
ncbi:MAG: methylenetetrahydrofolate reductase [Thaumarchaeota archaeon]|nr:methylenetetrahydrofolate reductase [Nitrososphaerota archaeon]